MHSLKNDDNHIAVIGAGTMGAGIAQKYASNGYFVSVVERNEIGLKRAQSSINATLEQAVERKIFRQDDVNLIKANLDFSNDLARIAKSSLVIEAIFEDLNAKKSLFQDIEQIVSPQAIVATNTSSFSVSELQSTLKYPERFLGLHYFFHPAKNRLVEVIPTNTTDIDVTNRACFIQESIKKIIIKSKDSPGFIVNRFFVPWLNEAVKILAENKANSATIEHGAREFFQIPMGPFQLMNVTGIPITMHAANAMAQSLGEFYVPCQLIAKQIEKSEPWPLLGEVDQKQAEYVAKRLLSVVSVIACQLVFEENIGGTFEVDLGARVGLLWPKGPFELINQNQDKIKNFLCHYS
ncbi:MAG: 3-hydroxyacyl-CoA dehydrogenase family protein, partial [Myxococcales bacterium]|nr:3-hydroxyacyl-CoA dehydrogenase family protein [Myxococcales bacterium]